MANYINKTILSESYAHIDRVELSPEDKADFEMQIKAYQAPRAKRMLGLDIEPVVRTEDGSLKVYLTVYGSLNEALGEFDDFREALKLLYASSKMVAEACNLESLFLADATKKQLIRSEARTGVVKSTKDLLDSGLYINNTLEKFSQKRLHAIVDELGKRVVLLNKNLTESQDRALVWNQLLPIFTSLPSLARKLQLNPDDAFTKIIKENLNEVVKKIQEYHTTAINELDSL